MQPFLRVRPGPSWTDGARNHRPRAVDCHPGALQKSLRFGSIFCMAWHFSEVEEHNSWKTSRKTRINSFCHGRLKRQNHMLAWRSLLHLYPFEKIRIFICISFPKWIIIWIIIHFQVDNGFNHSSWIIISKWNIPSFSTSVTWKNRTCGGFNFSFVALSKCFHQESASVIQLPGRSLDWNKHMDLFLENQVCKISQLKPWFFSRPQTIIQSDKLRLDTPCLCCKGCQPALDRFPMPTNRGKLTSTGLDVEMCGNRLTIN
jgi:hypothetical protein